MSFSIVQKYVEVLAFAITEGPRISFTENDTENSCPELLGVFLVAKAKNTNTLH